MLMVVAPLCHTCPMFPASRCRSASIKPTSTSYGVRLAADTDGLASGHRETGENSLNAGRKFADKNAQLQSQAHELRGALMFPPSLQAYPSRQWFVVYE